MKLHCRLNLPRFPFANGLDQENGFIDIYGRGDCVGFQQGGLAAAVFGFHTVGVIVIGGAGFAEQVAVKLRERAFRHPAEVAVGAGEFARYRREILAQL